jgi:hypothetical protein
VHKEIWCPTGCSLNQLFVPYRIFRLGYQKSNGDSEPLKFTVSRSRGEPNTEAFFCTGHKPLPTYYYSHKLAFLSLARQLRVFKVIDRAKEKPKAALALFA